MIYYLTAIIIAINFLFSAPLSVHAADETHSGSSFDDENSSGHGRGGTFTLGDVVHDRHGTGSRGGGFQSFVGDTSDTFNAHDFVRQPVLTVLSSFAAVIPGDIDDIVTDLLMNEEFLDTIIFDPYNKTMKWSAETARHGGGTIRKYIEDTGLVTVDKWILCDATKKYHTSGGVWFDTPYTEGKEYYVCWIRQSDTTMYLMFASYNAALSRVYMSYDQNYTHDVYSKLDHGGIFNNKQLYYSTGFAASNYIRPIGESIEGAYLGLYDNYYSALVALAGGGPTSSPVPNGNGYIRPLPENQPLIATSTNIYNNNWPDIITNNYNTYGPSFETTTINNFYYTAPASGTPDYWYNVYPVESSPILEGTYGDLENVTFGDPNLQTDNMFVSDLFSALPVAVSGFIVSMVLLFVVVLFLRG